MPASATTRMTGMTVISDRSFMVSNMKNKEVNNSRYIRYIMKAAQPDSRRNIFHVLMPDSFALALKMSLLPLKKNDMTFYRLKTSKVGGCILRY